MPAAGEKIKFNRTGRCYVVININPIDTVLRSDDGLVSIVWTHELMNAIYDGHIIRNT